MAMDPRLPTLALTAALALSACGGSEAPDAAPPPGTPADGTPALAAPPAMPGETDATAVVERGPGAGAGDFDVRAFAGTFAATGASLALAADGSYAMTVRAESAGADLPGTGTWTVEDDGTRLRLDPDSKAEPDVVFAIRSGDELAQEGGGRVLRRDGG